jgi:hypothetical protein
MVTFVVKGLPFKNYLNSQFIASPIHPPTKFMNLFCLSLSLSKFIHALAPFLW